MEFCCYRGAKRKRGKLRCCGLCGVSNMYNDSLKSKLIATLAILIFAMGVTELIIALSISNTGLMIVNGADPEAVFASLYKTGTDAATTLIADGIESQEEIVRDYVRNELQDVMTDAVESELRNALANSGIDNSFVSDAFIDALVANASTNALDRIDAELDERTQRALNATRATAAPLQALGDTQGVESIAERLTGQVVAEVALNETESEAQLRENDQQLADTQTVATVALLVAIPILVANDAAQSEFTLLVCLFPSIGFGMLFYGAFLPLLENAYTAWRGYAFIAAGAALAAALIVRWLRIVLHRISPQRFAAPHLQRIARQEHYVQALTASLLGEARAARAVRERGAARRLCARSGATRRHAARRALDIVSVENVDDNEDNDDVDVDESNATSVAASEKRPTLRLVDNDGDDNGRSLSDSASTSGTRSGRIVQRSLPNKVERDDRYRKAPRVRAPLAAAAQHAARGGDHSTTPHIARIHAPTEALRESTGVGFEMLEMASEAMSSFDPRRVEQRRVSLRRSHAAAADADDERGKRSVRVEIVPYHEASARGERRALYRRVLSEHDELRGGAAASTSDAHAESGSSLDAHATGEQQSSSKGGARERGLMRIVRIVDGGHYTVAQRIIAIAVAMRDEVSAWRKRRAAAAALAARAPHRHSGAYSAPLRLIATSIFSLWLGAVVCFVVFRVLEALATEGARLAWADALGQYTADIVVDDVLPPLLYAIPLVLYANLALHLYLTHRCIRQTLLQMRRGKRSWPRQRESVVINATWYMAYAVLHCVAAILLQFAILLVLAVLIIALVLNEDVSNFFENSVLPFVAVFVGQKLFAFVLMFLFFTRWGGRQLNNVRFLSLFDIVNTLVATLTVPFIVIVRFVLLLFTMIVTLSRIEVPAFHGEFELFDPACNSAWAMMLAAHRFQQPCVTVFVHRLRDDHERHKSAYEKAVAAGFAYDPYRALLRRRRVARWWMYALMYRNRWLVKHRRQSAATQ